MIIIQFHRTHFNKRETNRQKKTTAAEPQWKYREKTHAENFSHSPFLIARKIQWKCLAQTFFLVQLYQLFYSLCVLNASECAIRFISILPLAKRYRFALCLVRLSAFVGSVKRKEISSFSNIYSPQNVQVFFAFQFPIAWACTRRLWFRFTFTLPGTRHFHNNSKLLPCLVRLFFGTKKNPQPLLVHKSILCAYIK